MRRIAIKSHAKINLGLNIIRKRDDGFHDLETIFYPLELCDNITFEKSDIFTFTCNDASLHSDAEGNLIVKAIRKLEVLSGRSLPVRVILEKAIPMGAGLGGGSSNAAVTLLSVNEMFQLQVSDVTLCAVAAELGSDVPYFLKLRPAFATGRGEKLNYFNTWMKKHILLVNPGIHVATAWAYKNIIPAMPEKSLGSFAFDTAFNYDMLIPYMHNDFEKPVFLAHPAIKEIKEKMLASGADAALMSGSGSSVFGLFANYEQAEKAAELLRAFPFVYLEKYEEDSFA